MSRMSNNAYAYEYDATAVPYTIPPQKIQEKQILLTELKQKREDKKTKKHIIISVFILVALGLTVAFRYASVTQINYENHKLEREYQRKIAIAQNLKVEIESSMSITEIAEIAETKLGMHKPFAYQIKYIDVDLPDQVEFKNIEFTKEKSDINLPFSTRLWKDVKLFFGVIPQWKG